MKIGIVGAGNIGGTLARYLTAAGHHVAIANRRGPETLAEVAARTGAHPAALADVGRDAEVVIVSVPLASIPELRAAGLRLPVGAVVVDTGNYYPQRDGRIDEIERGTTESRWVSRRLGRPGVKAFNNIYAQHLLEGGKPKGAPRRIALPVAGDDRRAKEIVIRLVDELGFDGVDAGGLDESWRQQPESPVYLADLDTEGVRKALAAATPERPESFSATESSPGSYANPA